MTLTLSLANNQVKVVIEFLFLKKTKSILVFHINFLEGFSA